MRDNKGGLLKAWGICLLSGFLLGLSFPARAETTITSLTASPSSVTAGEAIAFDMTVVTTALETLTGSATTVLSRDGVTVSTDQFQGLLDLTNVNNGVIHTSLPLDPGLYSEPGAYRLDVSISGQEDGHAPFADSAATTFDVRQTTQPPPDVVVSPSALSLAGVPGEIATGTFTITQGTGPFTVQTANTDRGSIDNPNPDVGETVTYGFRWPGSGSNQQFTDTITVTPAAGNPVTIPVTITAANPGNGGNGNNDIDDAMQSIAKTQPQSATGAVIGTVCPQGIVAPRLQEDCNVVVGAALTPEGSNPNNQASMALGQVTTDQAATPVNASQTSVAAQNRNLASRISALQQGVRMGLSAGGLSFHLDGETLPAGQLAEDWMRQLANSAGGAAGSDSIFTSGRLGVFINGNVSLGDRDRTSNQEGFDFQTNGITLGADYRFTDQLALGAAIGYMNNNTDLDASGGGLDADGYSLSLYGTFFQDSGLYLDGIASFGRSDYDQRRNIRYNIGSVSVDQTASSDFDGDQWSASFGGGYSFSRGALAFGPTARIEYVNSDVDGFEETMSNPNADGGGWATRIEGQEVDSFTLQLGGDLSYAISQSWGVLLPQLHAEWVHEFKDNAHNVDGHFLLDPSNTAFSLNTDTPDSDYFNLSLGVSAQFAQGRSAYIYYRKLLGYRDLDMDSFSAGVRLEF